MITNNVISLYTGLFKHPIPTAEIKRHGLLRSGSGSSRRTQSIRFQTPRGVTKQACDGDLGSSSELQITTLQSHWVPKRPGAADETHVPSKYLTSEIQVSVVVDVMLNLNSIMTSFRDEIIYRTSLGAHCLCRTCQADRMAVVVGGEWEYSAVTGDGVPASQCTAVLIGVKGLVSITHKYPAQKAVCGITA